MGAARWAALILLPCMPALAQDEDGEDSASQDQYAQDDGEQSGCPGAAEVVNFGPTKDNSEERDVKITGETFRITYNVEVLEPGDFSFLTLERLS